MKLNQYYIGGGGAKRNNSTKQLLIIKSKGVPMLRVVCFSRVSALSGLDFDPITINFMLFFHPQQLSLSLLFSATAKTFLFPKVTICGMPLYCLQSISPSKSKNAGNNFKFCTAKNRVNCIFALRLSPVEMDNRCERKCSHQKKYLPMII